MGCQLANEHLSPFATRHSPAAPRRHSADTPVTLSRKPIMATLRGPGGQTCMISFSLAASAASISAIVWSVAFCTCSE